jgi:hypothetical protein
VSIHCCLVPLLWVCPKAENLCRIAGRMTLFTSWWPVSKERERKSQPRVQIAPSRILKWPNFLHQVSSPKGFTTFWCPTVWWSSLQHMGLWGIFKIQDIKNWENGYKTLDGNGMGFQSWKMDASFMSYILIEVSCA